MNTFKYRIMAMSSYLFISCAPTDDYSKVHSDSGIHGRSYQEITDELYNLEKSHPEMAKVIPYGKSLLGQQLTMLRIGKSLPATNEKRPAVIIEGTIHGDEFLNIEDRLPRWFLDNQNSPGVNRFLSSGGIIYITPILNPDGYDNPQARQGYRQRENMNNKDLNRDFPLKAYQGNRRSLTQPEIKSLVEVIDKQLIQDHAQLKLSMDYHCCVGAIIYPWGFSQTKQLDAPAKTEHLRLVDIMRQQFPNYGHGRAIEVVNYTAIGASDDYFHETYGATAFTFEGVRFREKDNFEKHTNMWDNLLGDQAGPQINQQSPSTFALAILEDGQGNAPLTALGAPNHIQKISVCLGHLAECTNGQKQPIWNYNFWRSVADRNIFTTNQRLPLSSGNEAVITLLGYDQQQTLKSAETIHLKGQ